VIDGLNRFVLSAVGLLLAVVGGLGLAASDGAFDDLHPPARIYRDAREAIRDHPDIWFAVVLSVGGLVLLLSLWWLSRQFASRPGGPHLSTVVLHADRRGRTTLEPVGLARALGHDLETVHGVRKAKVRVRAIGQEAAMRVRLTVDRGVDPDEVLEHAEPALHRAAQTVEAAAIDARIRIDFAGRDESRVV
jgi:hypothetical protein